MTSTLSNIESHLAKYHVLHFVIGAILAAILLGIPKLVGVCVAVLLIAILLPSALLPADLPGSKWISRAACVLGAILVGVAFHFLGKI